VLALKLGMLKKQLRQLSIEADYVRIENRSSSFCGVLCDETDIHARKTKDGYSKIVPILSIYVQGTSNFQSLQIDPHRNNWSSDYAGTSRIREMWKVILTGHRKVSDYYDDDMLVFFFNNVEKITCAAVYEYRTQVKKMVCEMDVTQPKEIFCCSAPGYNVIYQSSADYGIAMEKKEFLTIETAIKKRLQKRIPDRYKEDFSVLLKVAFYHLEMENFSWYGFYRQD